MPARPPHPVDTWRAPKPDAEPPTWRPGPFRPVIGITTDIADPAPAGSPPKPRATLPLTYVRAVTGAGGLPVLIPPVLELVHEYARRCDAFVFTGGDDEYARRCDAFVFTGGDDPRTESFGEPTHPKATPVHPDRQAFEVALLNELQRRPAAPVLGVCLGMQMMALHAGGALHQHMPEVIPTAEDHRHDATHAIRTLVEPHPLIEPGAVTSHHRQAVREPGRLRVVAVAPDGVIEAIDDPARAFYLGVQWHPERTPFEPLGATIFARLVQAARADR